MLRTFPPACAIHACFREPLLLHHCVLSGILETKQIGLPWQLSTLRAQAYCMIKGSAVQV